VEGRIEGRRAGMSCACPSVSAMTPARRARGISASARSIAAKRRVPWLPASGTSTVRSSRSGRRPARASISRRAASIWRAGGDGGVAAVHHQQGDVRAGLARFLDEARIGQRQQDQREGRAASSAPRARRSAAGTSAAAPASAAATASEQPERQDGREVEAGDGLGHARPSRRWNRPDARSGPRARSATAPRPTRARGPSVAGREGKGRGGGPPAV
jgi:hypothetical protein